MCIKTTSIDYAALLQKEQSEICDKWFGVTITGIIIDYNKNNDIIVTGLNGIDKDGKMISITLHITDTNDKGKISYINLTKCD